MQSSEAKKFAGQAFGLPSIGIVILVFFLNARAPWHAQEDA
jgi:hypothetical protein